MKILIYTVGYDSAFKKAMNGRIGWGCGYILIPLDHKFLQSKEVVDEDSVMWYTQIPSFSEEITLDESKVVNGITYKCLGFDTAHSWNNDTHNYEWVLNKTLEMQRIVEGV